MDKFFEKVSITTLLLLHLFVCGGLYIIGFWTTFNFDVTNYLDVMDIPKSFVLPLALSSGLSLINIISQSIAGPEKRKETKQNDKPSKFQNSLFYKALFSETGLAFVFILTAFTLIIIKLEELFYIFVCIFLMIYISYKVSRQPSFYIWFPSSTIRLLFIYLGIALPIISFLLGKLNSLAIHKNENFFAVANIEFSDDHSDSVYLNKKLLGKLGQTIFLTDSMNENIQVLNLDFIRNIEYKQNKKMRKMKN